MDPDLDIEADRRSLQTAEVVEMEAGSQYRVAQQDTAVVVEEVPAIMSQIDETKR